MKAVRITQWDMAHETYESRKLNVLNWVPVPNRHDGLGFGFLREQDDRVTLYCAFTLMLQIASKGPRGQRGWLVRNGRPLNPRDMARMTGFPEEIFAQAIAFFQRAEIAWLEEQEIPADLAAKLLDFQQTLAAASKPAGLPAAASTSQQPTGPSTAEGREGREGREQNGMEGEGGVPPPAPGSQPPSLEEVKKAGRQLAIPAAYAEHYWRKKQEGQTAWFDKQNRKRLINWPQQLENWWIEDREKPQWQEKNGAAATVVDLEAALHREKDPERRRQLKEQIERSK